jgi:hypothetical protein
MKAEDIVSGVKNGTIDPKAVICVAISGGGIPIMKEGAITPTYNKHTEYETRDEDGFPTVRRGPVIFVRE